tara:strand:- start:372 stop:599 length:228 start_codon:yes stop_codon:yes gene_type:complete
MSNLGYPTNQLSGTSKDAKSIGYLRDQGCTVSFDPFGVYVYRILYDKQIRIGKQIIRRETLELCVNAFNKNEWDK